MKTYKNKTELQNDTEFKFKNFQIYGKIVNLNNLSTGEIEIESSCMVASQRDRLQKVLQEKTTKKVIVKKDKFKVPMIIPKLKKCLLCGKMTSTKANLVLCSKGCQDAYYNNLLSTK